MSLKFYISASGAGKSTKVYRDILERAKMEENTRYFIVVPDQFTMETQRVLCAMSESGGIMNIEVLSFNRLAHRIFEELGFGSLPRLDDTGKNLILRKVAGEHEKELSVIGAFLKKTGYIAQVKSMISEFAQYGIMPEDMEAFLGVAKEKGSLLAKLKDLQLLYQGYREYISGHFITTEETIDILVRNVQNSVLLKDSVVVFDGFTGFTPIQELLLKELMLCTKQVIVTLLGDEKGQLCGEIKEQDLFYLTARAYHRLERLAEENGIARDKDEELLDKPVWRHLNNPALSHLEKSLFRKDRILPISGKEAVSLVRCQNPKKETEWVCATIHKLIREKGYCYRDFAVITGDLASYGPSLKKSFAEQGIPLFLDRNVSLLFHPFMVFLHGLVRMVIKDFSYDTVMPFVRTGYLDVSPEEIDAFENYLIRYGVRGRRKYERAFVRTCDESETVNRVREQIIKAAKPLLASQKNARDYIRALYDTCVIFSLEAKLKSQAEAFAKAQDFVREKEYEQVYRAVMALFDQIYALLDEAVELEEFGEILQAGFAELKVGSLPQSVDQVTAGDLERTRLKPVKVLFVIGVNDGIIPGKGGSGGLLSDMERDFLLQAGMELAPTPRQKGFEERLYLYMNMTQPSEKLCLSFSEVNAKGEGLRPSYLINRVERLFTDVRTESAPEGASLMESREDGIRLLSHLLREYAAGVLEDEEETLDHLGALARIFERDPEFASLAKAAFYDYKPTLLSDKLSRALYGETISTSISRLERFAACAYAHFLRYGLKLSEEDAYTFEAVDLGNLFHETLYRFGCYMAEGPYTWLTCPKEEADLFIEKAVDEFAAEYGGAVLYDTARSEALKERAKEILKITVNSLSFQLRKGKFVPAGYEVPFSMKDGVNLYGKVDRVDTAEASDKVYVKVLDYKSGKHGFDPAKLFAGLDLQLPVYMNGAVESFIKQYPAKEVVPAALFYYRIDDPMVEEDGEDHEEKIQKSLRVQGVIREDDKVFDLLDQDMAAESLVVPIKKKKDGALAASSQTVTGDTFDLIGKFASKKTKELGKCIAEGEIAVSPAKSGQESACQYCGYQAVCGFEKRIPGFVERDLSMKEAEAYEEMKKYLEKEQ